MSAVCEVRDYIIGGCNDGIRYDGRNNTDFRVWKVENNIFPHVNGSGRVSIGESVDVCCAVKLEIGEPEFSFPGLGRVEFNIEISNPDHDVYRSEIGTLLQRIYTKSGAIDFRSLSIIYGKKCWVVHIDLMIVKADGNPLDACSVAAYLSLQCSKLPKVELFQGDGGAVEDFDVSGDLADSHYLDISKVPIVVSAYKIGSVFAMDTESSEQQAASSCISVAFDSQSSCCGVVKSLRGVYNVDDMSIAVEQCDSAARDIFRVLEEYSAAQRRSGLGEGLNGLYPEMVPLRAGFAL